MNRFHVKQLLRILSRSSNSLITVQYNLFFTELLFRCPMGATIATDRRPPLVIRRLSFVKSCSITIKVKKAGAKWLTYTPAAFTHLGKYNNKKSHHELFENLSEQALILPQMRPVVNTRAHKAITIPENQLANCRSKCCRCVGSKELMLGASPKDLLQCITRHNAIRKHLRTNAVRLQHNN